jgi:hypothetical protein
VLRRLGVWLGVLVLLLVGAVVTWSAIPSTLTGVALLLLLGVPSWFISEMSLEVLFTRSASLLERLVAGCAFVVIGAGLWWIITEPGAVIRRHFIL